MRALHRPGMSPWFGLLFVALGALALGLGACGQKDSGVEVPETEAGAAQDGASTPKGVVDGMAAAISKSDFPGIIPFILPEQRAVLSFGMGVLAMGMQVGMLEALLPVAAVAGGKEAEDAKKKVEGMKKDHEELLARYKLTGVGMEKIMSLGRDEDAMLNLANQTMGNIDHAAFLREALVLMNSYSDDQSKVTSPLTDIDLSKVTIKEEGDTALVSIPGDEDDLKLVKKSGRWYADLMSMKRGK